MTIGAQVVGRVVVLKAMVLGSCGFLLLFGQYLVRCMFQVGQRCDCRNVVGPVFCGSGHFVATATCHQ